MLTLHHQNTKRPDTLFPYRKGITCHNHIPSISLPHNNFSSRTPGFLSFGTLHLLLPPTPSFSDYSTSFLLNYYASPFPLPMQFNDTLHQRKPKSQIMFATVGCLPDLFLPLSVTFRSFPSARYKPSTNSTTTRTQEIPCVWA